MTSPPVRIGIVGCGRLSEAGYVPACGRAVGVRLVAVADPDASRRTRVAAQASAPGAPVAAFADASALLQQAEVDAIVLATPAAAHVADATLAVEAGTPVLVEKPPAVDARGSARLLSLGPLVRVAFNRRFDPGAEAVRADVPPQEELDLRLELAYRRSSWAAHTVRDEVLLDLVPHLVDWARWLTGSEITDVAATELTHDRASLTVALGRGRATILAAADSIHRERIDVRNGSGERLARHRAGGLVGAALGRVPGRRVPHPLEASLAAQLAAFARTVRGAHDEVLATTADGHAVMTVIDAARRSAGRGGRPTPVTDPWEHVPC